MPKATKTKNKTANQTATGQKPDKATSEKAEQKHDQSDKTPAQNPAPAKLPLNREKRENLIQWWRSQGWTYEQITSKFAVGVTEAEYEEARAQWEA